MGRKKQSHSVADRVRRFLADQEGIDPAGRILVALSGGRDSCALLHVLASLRSEFSLDLSAAHVHHGLRQADADRDLEFSKAFAASLEVDFYSVSGDAGGWARRAHRSIQEAARELRHYHLFGIADETGATHLAIGHTEDDHLETILLNTVRGTGIDGLKGLPPRTGRVLRPLRDVTREETGEYCRIHGIAFRDDESNSSLRYRRNRVRTELLPNLATYYNPAVRDALKRLSDCAGEDADYLWAAACDALSRCTRRRDAESLVLDRAELGRCHPALARRVMRLAIELVRGTLADVDLATVDSILARSGEGVDFALTLKGARTRVEGREGVIAVRRVSAPASGRPVVISLLPEGWTDAQPFGGRFRTTFEDASGSAEAGSSPFDCALDADEIRGELRARNRRPGDRFQPLGMTGTRKLQDLFVDAKIPKERRDQVPLVVDDAGILWAVGHAVCHRARITPKTRRILRIKFEPPSGAGSPVPDGRD